MDLDGIQEPAPPYSWEDPFPTPEGPPPAYKEPPSYEDVVGHAEPLGEPVGMAESPMIMISRPRALSSQRKRGLSDASARSTRERKSRSHAVFAAEIEISPPQPMRAFLSLPLPSTPPQPLEGHRSRSLQTDKKLKVDFVDRPLPTPKFLRTQSHTFMSEDGLPQPIESYIVADAAAVIKHAKRRRYLQWLLAVLRSAHELCDLHLVPEVEALSSAMSLSTMLSKPVHGAQGGWASSRTPCPGSRKGGYFSSASPSVRDVASNEPGHVIKYPVDCDGFGDDAAVVLVPPHGQINRIFGRTPAARASPYLKRVSIPKSPIQESAPVLVLLVCLSRTPQHSSSQEPFTDGTDPDERRRRKNVARESGLESPDGVYELLKSKQADLEAALVKIVLAQDPCFIVLYTKGETWTLFDTLQAFIKVIIDFKTPDRDSHKMCRSFFGHRGFDESYYCPLLRC
ncbi:hypothetical protein K438DRAFT_2055814 [Mycena galopus ATCC 62051]|nr:hypothetical protein K438DRAFT_2055814 [Mycena galopus ATCC 62051]